MTRPAESSHDGHEKPKGWIGASVPRKEDKRHQLGASTFVADLRMPRMQDIAFVRSEVAHARLIGIEKPEAHAGKVFTLADLGNITCIDAGPELTSFRTVPYPPLADD